MPRRTLQQAPAPFQALIDEWARSLRAENKSARTIRGYTDAARFFHIWIADPTAPPDTDDPDEWLAGLAAPPSEPSDLDKSHARDWIAYRIATTSPGNANNNFRALQQWGNWLLDEGEIEQHFMAGLKPPHVPEQPVPIVPDAVINAVLDGCSGRDFLSRRDEAIIRLLWDTGCRLSEIAGLDHNDDLDLVTDSIRVLGKGGKHRAVPFSPKTGKALGRYLRVRARHPDAELPALWLGDRRRGPLSANGIKIMLRRRGRAAGVNDALGRNLHAHLGRHYQSHHFLAAGGSEGDLMRLNGWTTPQMARRYGQSAAVERAHETARRLRVGDRLK
ncbi:tyrosine-type recombinase/integrase [Amycolatopsis thermoflava]|uniref:tyrosine-type recombinase/integrase n=1 Tax=Amycolatopsis thermoflava TaxID=84480 RepID=UPI00382A0ED7